MGLRTRNMKQRTKIILVVVVLAGVLLGAWFFMWRIKWETYISPRFGYSAQYPAGWTLNDSQKDFPVTIIVSPDNDFALHIGVFSDENVVNEDGFKSAMFAVKRTYDENPASKILLFDPIFHEGEDIRGGYTVAALFTGKDEIVYEISEVGIIMADGTVYVLTIYVDRRVADKYTRFIEEMPLRFIPKEYRNIGL